MIIMSYDRKHVIDAKLVSVSRNFGGGKDGKYYIIASCFGVSDAGIVVGKYPDEKTASDELERIFAAFADGAVSYSVQ